MFENLDVPKAWKDADYRESLTPDPRDRLPENRAGLIELSDENLSSIAGGHPTVSPTTGSGCGSELIA